MANLKDVNAATKLVKEMDVTLDESEPSFLSALVLVTMTEVGTSVEAVQKFIGYSEVDIKHIIMNLQTNGVVRGDRIYSDWLDEESGGISFWADVLVGCGMLKRA